MKNVHEFYDRYRESLVRRLDDIPAEDKARN